MSCDDGYFLVDYSDQRTHVVTSVHPDFPDYRGLVRPDLRLSVPLRVGRPLSGASLLSLLF
jgi:hypothetical protein